jgi:hypothetical protein
MTMTRTAAPDTDDDDDDCTSGIQNVTGGGGGTVPGGQRSLPCGREGGLESCCLLPLWLMLLLKKY